MLLFATLLAAEHHAQTIAKRLGDRCTSGAPEAQGSDDH
jgi:hypothetical protein